MAYRAVTHLTRGEDGDILLLCNHRETWSPRVKEDAIDDIESGRHTYYLDDQTDSCQIVVSSDAEKGKILVAAVQGRSGPSQGRT